MTRLAKACGCRKHITATMMTSATVTQKAWLEIILLEERLLLDADNVLDRDAAASGVAAPALPVRPSGCMDRPRDQAGHFFRA